ncbi:hypothetical protein EW146_g10056 [Bondarzewia mesenterica]|uniref:Major facilitator superfamily (MFS) profile domain-containing protein n=1 Tax=Bondarzewia mesenterica TaxID=1095465 RepID=A0A4S4L0R0_9AGAM|nr:hypothetical protein EW146_g10056 [Bondarzewia mesenterica]
MSSTVRTADYSSLLAALADLHKTQYSSLSANTIIFYDYSKLVASLLDNSGPELLIAVLTFGDEHVSIVPIQCFGMDNILGGVTRASHAIHVGHVMRLDQPAHAECLQEPPADDFRPTVVGHELCSIRSAVKVQRLPVLAQSISYHITPYLRSWSTLLLFHAASFLSHPGIEDWKTSASDLVLQFVGDNMSDETTPLLSGSPPSSPKHRPCEVPQSAGAQQLDVNGNSDSDATKSFGALATTILPMVIGTFLAAMDATIVASSYASIGSELNQLQSTSWIATGYMLTLASFQPLYGKLSDIFGRKPCLLFAYVIFALGCTWCGLARNMNELIAARAFAGVGGGGMTTIVSIIMSDIVPLRSRGTWQGLINIVFATGSATGAPLGGILADSIGWRWAFLIQVPATLAAIISVSIALKIPKPEASHLYDKLKRVDFAGAFTLVIAILSLLLGLDRGGNVSWNDTLTLLCLVSFAVCSALFGLIETRIAGEPFAPKRIVVNPALLASYLCNFFCVASSMILIFYVSLYTQAVLNKSAADAGLALIPSIVGGVAGSLLGGVVMQTTGKYHAYTIATYVCMVIGAAIIALTTGAVVHSFLGMEVGLVLMSIGNGSGITTTLIALIANAGTTDQAVATAVSYLFRSLGSVVGLSVGSTLFQDTLRKYLHARLVGQDVEEIIRRVRESLKYVDQLEPAIRAIVRSSYEEALQATFWFAVVLAGLAMVSSIFIKEKSLLHAGGN